MIEVKGKPVEVINGYTLPPEPDPKINNSTLLGVDSNNNGVRDDVERYIIKRFSKDPKYPKTKIALAMQYAWAAQKILKNPTMASRIYEDKSISCQYYWFSQVQKETREERWRLGNSPEDFQKTIELGLRLRKWRSRNEVFGEAKLKDKIFNTRERIKQKFSYNAALSGNILKSVSNTIDSCQTNIDMLGE